ncbi:MAG: single-stranded DNA-binding protein [Deltaproteobacteria bacterium]|nr:single-stranded DNA-binding protein [Deltaproteobacteria bacterium]
MTVNKAILVGNLGQDPELRTTAGGSPVCTLRVATTDRRKDKDGNWSDYTEWHTVVVFGRQAETASTYLRKGRMVYVEGRLQTRKWQDRNGQDRWTTEIVADSVRFLGGGQQQGSGRRDAPRRDPDTDPGIQDEPPPPPDGDPPYEDVPF